METPDAPAALVAPPAETPTPKTITKRNGLLDGPQWHVKLVRARGSRRAREISVACAADIHAYVAPHLRDLPHEEFWVLACTVKNMVSAAIMLGRGILDASLVHPREVFKFAVLSNAATLILTHNHPGGNPEPSDEDVQLTKRVSEVGTLMGIPVLDHVIVGARGYVSFSERGYLA